MRMPFRLMGIGFTLLLAAPSLAEKSASAGSASKKEADDQNDAGDANGKKRKKSKKNGKGTRASKSASGKSNGNGQANGKKRKAETSSKSAATEPTSKPLESIAVAAPKPTSPQATPAVEVKKVVPPATSTAPAPAPIPPPLPKVEKPGKPAPTMTFEAVDVSGKSGERQRLDVALRQFKDEHYEQAAMTSHELMQDPKLAELYLDSEYLLAKSLYRMGMYHSSLGEFSKILAKGPQTKFFKSSLEWLFFISHKTLNESVILGEIAKYSNAEFPERFRNEFRYLLARYHFVRGKALDLVEQKAEANKSFEEVKRLALIVPKGDAFYARAKYLEGLAYFHEDKFNSALESMKEVVRVTRPGGTKSEFQARQDKEVRELAFMQLARTHYGHRQNRYAIYYYNKVERGGKQWLEALFESSWANYRIGQYEQALGNLITLSSPFFREEYFPEALILKAVIYYENCRYRESSWILEDFERIYLPVHDQLEVITKKEMDASEYYNVLADIQKKNKTVVELNNTDLILERILRLALTDKDLKNTNDSILELEAELDSITQKPDAFKYSDLSKNLVEGLKKQREILIKKAGIMAKGKLEFELGEIKKLLTNGLRIKFETTTKEKEFLEEQLREGAKAEVVKKYKYSVAVADDQLYWPYEGEYWRDELGTYQYTLTKGCIERNREAQAKRGDEL